MVNFLPQTERNLILTGYVGSQQPIIGRQVAERLRMRYVNFEALIAERVELPADEIRAYYGETRLKSIETELVQETALRRSTVIRVSGRTLLHNDHLERLKDTGPVICLTVQLGAMLQRLHITLGARFHNPDERALALGELKREWAIRGAAGIYEVDTTTLDDDEVIASVASLWQDLALERG